MQPRLLRVLQSGEYNRLGSTRTETADIRVIAATNRDLEREIESGAFRSDLFFRLATITLKLPPLRERVQDIHLLADHFLRHYASRFGKETPQLSPDSLSDRLRGSDKSASHQLQPMSIAEMEKRLIVLVLKTTEGSRTRAAEILGISREGLRTKMQRYGFGNLEAG